MTPRVRATGAPVARECRDGGQVKLSTFIPLKIRKRGTSKVVVRPDGRIEVPGKVATQHDQPLLVALTRAFYWQQMIETTAWSAAAARSPSGKACTTRRSMNCYA